MLDYKLFHLNMDSFMEKLNQYFRENSSRPGELLLHKDMRVSEAFSMNTVLYNPEQKRVFSMDQLSEGMRSMYLLSLLEAYAQEPTSLPSIILMEDPEIFLHPKMQKTAGEVLYRLSRKNQIIFCTHSPTMIFNFNSRQIKQIRLDEDGYTVADENPDIDEVLDNLGYSANDLMNVSFVFIVEGKQDSSRLPLLLEKYYAEIYTGDDKLRRIAIIPVSYTHLDHTELRHDISDHGAPRAVRAAEERRKAPLHHTSGQQAPDEQQPFYPIWGGYEHPSCLSQFHG